MGAFSARETQDGGVFIVELLDEERGQRARILPSAGANCYAYESRHRGQVFQLLEKTEPKTAADNPTGRGIPILFPFPNRVRNGAWTFRGKTYQFENVQAAGHHLHGLVYNRQWTVQSLEAGEEFAACSMSFDAESAEGVLEQYPFPFHLTAAYTLAGGALQLTFSALNAGGEDMPMGVGFHPYFSAPIGEETDPSDCIATVPADAYWELDELLPTGRILPVFDSFDLRQGQPFEGMSFDDLFTQVSHEKSGVSRCSIEDRAIRLRTVLESGKEFRELVLYTPPNRRSLCIEPYTCPTDAANLEARGIEAGLIVLPPGGVFTGSICIYPEAF
ncbi:MAG: aldose 1-epimerase [Candidatus Poribacteria bacterium]|nr:aldose 1-epimerase [Candidatus Poribacteria bacterium]